MSLSEALKISQPKMPLFWSRYDPKLHKPGLYEGIIGIDQLFNNASFLGTTADKLLINMISFYQQHDKVTTETYEIETINKE